jgi:two-component system response regulator CpxR
MKQFEQGKQMPRILIVDDDCGLFALLDEYLGSFGFSCFHAADGDAGTNALAAEPWDAVILDVMLPRKTGHEVLAWLRAHPAPSVRSLPVLMLTARGGEDDKVRGLEAGADDYLAKPFGAKELVARLHALLRRVARSGEGDGSGDALVLDDLVVDRNSMTLSLNDARIEITPSELRLLELFSEMPGRVVDRETLYMRILNHPPFGQDRSLDMMISRLRKKLGTRRDGGERIRAARGEGYMFLLSGDAQ